MKKNSKALKYALKGLIILALNLFFSLVGALFLLAEFAPAINVIASIIVLVMLPMIIFFMGGSNGEADYKMCEKSLTLSEKSEFRIVKINVLKSCCYLISYAAPIILLTLIGALIKTGFFKGLAYMIFLPFIWGASEDFSRIIAFVIYLVYTLIVCGVFIFSYILRVNKLKRVRREIASELRSFNN